ncbi:cell wall-active antibiotics response protein LiaF [Allofustis seminis]|uniref:cell wall-active antibiotics response protein LiaF n=1 Tax=Allofustis seminis TaxID=166939 RepID=UPI000377D037|nr:cell wall-active antibiotics response protein LiaF [Allofustis seminis]
MKNKRKIIILILLAFLFGYETLVQPGIGIQMVLGAALILWRNDLFKDSPGYGWGFGLLLITVAILSTQFGWLLIGVVLVVLLGKNQSILNSMRDIWEQRNEITDHEYIAVEFQKGDKMSPQFKKQELFGEYEEGMAQSYEWEDMNLVKIAGTTIIDLGNTILPIGDNTVVVNQWFGTVKFIVPKGVNVSLDVSYIYGNYVLDGVPLQVRSENIKWKTKEFATSPRRVKIFVNGIVGRLEVVFI